MAQNGNLQNRGSAILALDLDETAVVGWYGEEVRRSLPRQRRGENSEFYYGCSARDPRHWRGLGARGNDCHGTGG
jgi:hypothetical protein